jgi:hypothetical protein
MAPVQDSTPSDTFPEGGIVAGLDAEGVSDAEGNSGKLSDRLGSSAGDWEALTS